MEKNSLHDLVAKLRAELSDALRANPKSEDSLSDMMQDIDRLVDKPAEPPSTQHRSLAQRLERIAVRFEADHPTLAATARQLVDLLGEVGI